MGWAEKKKEEPGITPTEAPAEKGVVMICERCGGHSFAKDLKSELKHLAKDELGKKALRVVFTSCMSICPKEGIAIGLAHVNPPAPTEFFVADGDAHAAADGILRKIK